MPSDCSAFTAVLRQIYFELGPSDLLNCSLVCKRWKSFLDRHVWNVGRGAARRRRITENWMIRMPTITEIRLLTGNMDQV